MSAILAAVLATTAYPFVCDANWWRGKQLEERMAWYRAPRGLEYNDNECRLNIGWTQMLSGERLWVFSGKPCGLECRRTKTSHVVPRRVAVDAWVLRADSWHHRQLEFTCGDGTSRPNELARSSDFAKHDWCVSSDPKGCP